VEANQSDHHKLWQMVDDLLGRGRTSPSSAIDVEVFSWLFADKVAKVRLSNSKPLLLPQTVLITVFALV